MPQASPFLPVPGPARAGPRPWVIAIVVVVVVIVVVLLALGGLVGVAMWRESSALHKYAGTYVNGSGDWVELHEDGSFLWSPSVRKSFAVPIGEDWHFPDLSPFETPTKLFVPTQIKNGETFGYGFLARGDTLVMLHDETPSADPADVWKKTEGGAEAAPSLPVSKARVEGIYNGKVDWTIKPNCAGGPCGGLAKSGSQTRIHFAGHGTYRGQTQISKSCAEGGISIRLPLRISLSFRPTKAEWIGSEWLATAIDVQVQWQRPGGKKSVRVSPTTTRTLTCDAIHKTERFSATLTG